MLRKLIVPSSKREQGRPYALRAIAAPTWNTQ